MTDAELERMVRRMMAEQLQEFRRQMAMPVVQPPVLVGVPEMDVEFFENQQRQFELSTKNSTTVRVATGMLLGVLPTSFVWNDAPFVELAATNGQKVYAKVVVGADGAVSSRTIAVAGSVPADTTTDFHCEIGTFGSTTSTNTRFGPIEWLLNNGDPSATAGSGESIASLVKTPTLDGSGTFAVRRLKSANNRLTIAESGNLVTFTAAAGGTSVTPYSMNWGTATTAYTDTWSKAAPPGGTDGVEWQGPRLIEVGSYGGGIDTTDSNMDTTTWEGFRFTLFTRKLKFDSAGALVSIAAENAQTLMSDNDYFAIVVSP